MDVDNILEKIKKSPEKILEMRETLNKLIECEDDNNGD